MRLFIAVNLPDVDRAAVAAAVAPLCRSSLPIRWIEPSAYHLTLRFLGEVPESGVEPVASAVRTVAEGVEAFSLRLRGAGAFPSERHPNVVWVGIEGGAALRTLHRACETVLASLGHPPEGRPFAPHLTIGRTRRDAPAGALRDAAKLIGAVQLDRTVAVQTVDLMRSHLNSRGARYELLCAAPLRS